MSETLELVQKPSVIEQSLEKANVTAQVIAKLKEEYLPIKINGIDDKAGYKVADEARKQCKSLRVLAGKICKEGREEAIKIQKDWIAKEKEVTGEISTVEEHLESELKKVDDEKERIRLEEEKAEALRIQTRVSALIDNGCAFDGNNYSIAHLTIDALRIKTMSNETFAEFLQSVTIENEKMEAAKAEVERLRIEAEQKAEAERLAEIERMRKEREELEAMRKEQQEREAAIIAEQKRIADEQATREAEISRQQAEIEKQKRDAEAAKQAEIDRVANEARIAKEREEAARIAAEAERRKVEEEQRQAEQQRLAAIEEEKRLAALAPDKDKLLAYSKSLAELQIPTCENEAAIKIADEIRAMVTKMQNHISNKVKFL